MPLEDVDELNSEVIEVHGRRGPSHARSAVTQRDAILQALRTFQKVDRDSCFIHGLPGCGRIRRLAARIRELRLMGYLIRTNWDPAANTCTYELNFRS